ncbi:FAD-dependent oxidoreductase [Streptomyces sp. NPDC101116]|uniref:FAD-dependent oxidoreductase n=1 Tax=Streptomyces sp. NPDC101116 TaxID=3366107 RepID=UPI003808557B
MPDPTPQTPQRPAMDVLVVGAGPTGLTLACDLARRGVRTHVIEAGDRLLAGSRGKSLQSRTMEVFDDLGVVDALRAGGSFFPPMQTWRDGERQGEWQLIEPDPRAPASRHPRPWLVPQWRTLDILRERLLDLGGTLECGARLTSLTQSGTQVAAEVTHSDGARRLVSARYLVGADGSRSTVRESLGIALKGEDGGLRSAVVADVRVRGLDRDHWHIWPDPAGELLLCPLPGTADFQLNAKITGEEFTATPETVRGLIAARTHLTSEAVTDVGWFSFYRPRTAMAERFRHGRVLLAGDAAHVHPPGGGQGLNIGVQDAYNLGWKLGQVVRCHAPDALLDSYEVERRAAAADTLNLSTRLYRAGRSTQDPYEQARYRGRVCHLLSVHYRDSELSADARESRAAAGVQAGDRVPDLPCVTTKGPCGNLFELLRGPDFTLLAVNCAPPAAPAGLRTHQVTGGPLAEELGTGLFLIRPDQHIGLAADTAEHLDRYLAQVGLGSGDM